MTPSIIAVVVGFVVGGLLNFGTDRVIASLFPDEWNAAAYANATINNPKLLTLVLAFAPVLFTFPAYVTAVLAPRRPMRHVWILAVLTLAVVAVAKAANWSALPAWHNWVILAMVVPCVCLGGWLRERQRGVVQHGFGAPTV